MRNFKRAVAVTLIVAILSFMTPILSLATDTVALTNSVSANQSNIQSAINAASAGGSVTVTGTQSNITAGLTLNIPSSVTVVWRAFYVGAPGEYLIRLTGNGNFEVSSGAWIENTGSGNAIFAPLAAGSTGNAQITVSAGVVAANTGNAIFAEGPGAVVTVTNIGSVFNNAANNLRPAINMTGNTGTAANPTNPLENVRILGGSVASISLDGSGFAIQTYGNVRVEDPAHVFVTNGRAINLVGMNSTATINGGTVEAIGTGIAISTATTATLIAQVANARVVVTGGTVRAVNGVAIQTTGLNSRVEITGGMVSNTSSGSTGNAAINVTGENTVIDISGGQVWSENGRAVTATSSASNATINVRGGIVGSRGSGNTIHTMGSVGSINISGGEVAAVSGYAINLSATGAVNVTGGQVYAMSRYAVYAVNGTFAMTGGFAFAHGSAVGDVVRNAAFTGPAGNGIVVGWENPGERRYVDGSHYELFILPQSAATENEVRWAGGGIDYSRGNNSGHLNIPSVTVYAYHGLIFDVSSGRFYRNIDGSFTVNPNNVEYTHQSDKRHWNQNTNTLTLSGFNWFSDMDDVPAGAQMQVALFIEDSSNPYLAENVNLTINLEEGSTNIFRSEFSFEQGVIPRIFGIYIHPSVSSVTITGDGELEATGGDLVIAPPIPGFPDDPGSASYGIGVMGSSLVVQSGTVVATGGNAFAISTGIAVLCILDPNDPRTSNLTIAGGTVTGTGSQAQGQIAGAGYSWGIFATGTFAITGSILTAVGNTSAFPEYYPGPTALPSSYAYWTRADTTRPAANDIGIWVPSPGPAFTPNVADLFVRISTRPAAVIGNRVVSGTAWIALADTFSVDITLLGTTVDHDLMGEFVSQWFAELPNGVVVRANASAGSNTITLTFSGTPFRWFDGVFNITIPQNILSGATAGLGVMLNPEARFAIVTNPENPCPEEPPAPPDGPDGPVYGPYDDPPDRPGGDTGPGIQPPYYFTPDEPGAQYIVPAPQTGAVNNFILPLTLLLAGLVLVILAKLYRKKHLQNSNK